MMKVTYLSQSGFFLEMDDAGFLFDYYRGEIPVMAAEKKLYVFVSHRHYDHFEKSIFQLRDEFPHIEYILSDDIRTEETKSVHRMSAGQELELDNCKIQTLHSTDEGVAFLVGYAGKTFYHAGDLNWWHWEDESEAYNRTMGADYRREIDRMKGMYIDAAFIPVDPRLEKEYFLGLDYFMKQTETSIVFPMHFWEKYEVFDWLERQPEVQPYLDRILRIEREGQEYLWK